MIAIDRAKDLLTASDNSQTNTLEAIGWALIAIEVRLADLAEISQQELWTLQQHGCA